ncbi:carboxypeptidase regulatory-like domain-containing protein [Paraflavitalea soli]|uniref:Carboxypeptidase regulatory-like domain-containing protein n=1 Tax=Paraflavitalea soli TaxID=2315862 RepID=A0A3B7MJ47_9BACT|nr:carboxypeptidase-like regulatory domain-containing protein [Paraflavitalea soli]AXY73076.1 carboxypeptidase regulatory-like domain-containing protein [Paraflavitalea soli]
MKIQRLVMLTATLLATCIYLSCQKTASPDLPEPGPGHVPEYVTASISGRVTDDQRLPVSGATVKAGSATTTTDVNGAFTFSNINIDKTAGLVKVEKEGFFTGLRTLVLTPGKDNKAVIELLKKTVTGTINGSSGGTVTLPTASGSIVFEANSFLNTANHAGYTGTVSVSAYFINPAADNFQNIIPGALRGIDANNNETGLQSFGMMAVELTGTNGEKLQLAGGKKAVLHFPIPTSLQAQAPATIPLWSLNDSTGLWKEEGTATKQGTEYVGNVSHFSFWNCDAPFSIVDFTATLKTQQGTPLVNSRVVISGAGADSLLSGYGYTNGDGVVGGKIPSNRNLTLKVYDNCNRLLLTKNVGPFSSTANLGVVTVTSAATEATISGTVINCNAAAVTNGYVTISLEGMHYRTNLVNGAFGLTIVRCSNEATTATVIPYDITGNQAGTPASIPIAGAAINTGQLTACGTSLTQFVKYTINGTSYSYAGADSLIAHRTQSGQTLISGFRINSGFESTVDMVFAGEAAPGTYPLSRIFIREPGAFYVISGNINVTVTEYVNTAGGYVAGSFTGNIKDSLSSNISPINCSFRVKKYN